MMRTIARRVAALEARRPPPEPLAHLSRLTDDQQVELARIWQAFKDDRSAVPVEDLERAIELLELAQGGWRPEG